MKHEDISKKIIGAAYQVYNTLGFGFLESVYEKSLMIEIEKCGLNVVRQFPINVYYDEKRVGNFYADMFVENKVMVELKSVKILHKMHQVQLVNYLVATNTDIGLLINFGANGVEVKRKSRILPLK